MADDLQDRGKPDRDRVNVNEKWELDYWSKEFGVTPERLKEVEKKVGPMVNDIRKELGK